MIVEMLVHESCHCGENPLWHSSEKRLYWTDIDRGRLYRLNPVDGTHELVYEDRPVGGFTIQADGNLLLFRDRGNVVTWHNGSIHDTIVEEISEESQSRFNDVIADPIGRVFCGTLSTKSLNGQLYRLDLDGSLHCVIQHVCCTNGMAFSPDATPRDRLYYAETMAHTIWLFDYDERSGEIANQRPFLSFEDNKMQPDGLTVDAQGDIWCAFYGASCVICFGSDGIVKRRLLLPTACVTSCGFGGKELSELYVTTAGGNNKKKYGDTAGAVFRIMPVAKGVPEYVSRIGL